MYYPCLAVRQFRCFSMLTAVLLAGCGSDTAGTAMNSEGQPIQIAVCDMDKIANELGFLAQMNQIVSDRKIQLTNEVRILQARKQSELSDKIEEFREAPTEDQQKQLAGMPRRNRQFAGRRTEPIRH